MSKGLRKDQLKRLDECVRDEHGQPLTCYGCMGSAASMPAFDETLSIPPDHATDFPGRAVEWRCLHCVRNIWRSEFWKDNGGEAARKESMGQHKIIKEDSDLYCTMDAQEQMNFWKL